MKGLEVMVSTRAKGRSNSGTVYIFAGIITWPIVTLMIYWGDRFANSLSSLGTPGPAISFWAAASYALLLSVLIVIAGWVQSEIRSKS